MFMVWGFRECGISGLLSSWYPGFELILAWVLRLLCCPTLRDRLEYHLDPKMDMMRTLQKSEKVSLDVRLDPEVPVRPAVDELPCVLPVKACQGPRTA